MCSKGLGRKESVTNYSAITYLYIVVWELGLGIVVNNKKVGSKNTPFSTPMATLNVLCIHAVFSRGWWIWLPQRMAMVGWNDSK